MKRFIKMTHSEMEDHIARHLSNLYKELPLPDGLSYEFTHTRDGHQELVVRDSTTNECAVIHVYVDNELLSDESSLDLDDREALERDQTKLSLFMKTMCAHHWDLDVAALTKQMAVEEACKELGYNVELIDFDSRDSKRITSSARRCPDCSSIIAEIEGNILCPKCGWSGGE